MGTKTPRHREMKTINPRHCDPEAFFQRTKTYSTSDNKDGFPLGEMTGDFAAKSRQN